MFEAAIPRHESSAASAERSTAGPTVAITLNVNGKAQNLEVEPQTTLAEVLRGPLGLTGTKIGCDRGACSACTIWIDGMPMLSCMLLAVDVGERKITTIEGLARNGELHPVQTAFVEHDAVQCGYCTPGMVMSCAALVAANPHPSAEAIKAAIAGHLCRCGTYPHVLAAMQDLAGRKA
jgi:xanthine dehydrogenase YagT iron-sulfur-binding subunit